MLYSVLAIVVALVHLGFIIFVVIGGFFVLRWPQLQWIHIPAAIWGGLIEFFGWYCPLTSIEQTLLRKAGREGYSGGFIAHYLFSVIYPDGLTRGVEIGLGIAVVAINVGIYVYLHHIR